MREEIPALNSFGFMDNNGEWHSLSEENDKINEYYKLEYYKLEYYKLEYYKLEYSHLFDSKGLEKYFE